MKKRFWLWLWEHIDPVVALALGFIFSVLSLLKLVNPDRLFTATFATLTAIAFTLVKERSGREKNLSMTASLLTKLQEPVADQFFRKETSETPLLRTAEHEAWIVQETGSLITERNHAEIVNLLRNGGIVRCVLTAPTEPCARLVAFRNATLNYQTILSRHSQCHGQLGAILDRLGVVSTRLEVRYIPFPFDATTVIVDPKSPFPARQMGVVRYTGFGVPYPKKPDYIFRGDTSPQTLHYYYEEAQHLFMNASKVVLLAGPPRSGKTTIFKRLLDSHPIPSNLFYVITREIPSAGGRVGFEVVTSSQTAPKKFAVKQANGSYEVDKVVLTSIAAQLKIAHEQGKIVILDEIGPLQVQDSQFVGAVTALIQDPRMTIFATVASEGSHPFIDRVRRHYRSTLVPIESINEADQIYNYIAEELRTSLRLAEFITPEMWGKVCP